MNRRWYYILTAGLILFALAIVLGQTRDSRESKKAGLPQNEEATAGGSGAEGAGKFDEEHKKNVRTGLEAIFAKLKRMGDKSVVGMIEEAIAARDPGAIRRAFHEAIYGRFAKMSEVIPVLKGYLASSAPFVRYLAAEALLRIGDQSGVETLLKMVQSDEAISQGERDLRLSAAAALGTFYVKDAGGGIRELYSKTKEGELLDALAALGLRANEQSSWKYVSGRLAIEHYAKIGETRFIPQIKSTFDQTTDPETKNAAAWALARMTGEEKYVNYLSEAARPAIDSTDSTSFNASTGALKYLGSVQSPEAVRLLEEALDSRNFIVVRYAAVNLLFNQPTGSRKAEQLVLTELQVRPEKLEIDLAMQIASKSSNGEIRAAAQEYDRRTGGNRWRYWGVARANWPVQNWIFDYAETLN